MPRMRDFRVDPERAAGVWVEVGAGGYLKVARWLNPEHRGKVVELMQLEANQGRTLYEVQREAAGGTVLVGWGAGANGHVDANGKLVDGAEDFQDEDGNTLEFSEDVAVQLCTLPDWVEYWELIESTSRSAAHYREQRVEDTAGKS